MIMSKSETKYGLMSESGHGDAKFHLADLYIVIQAIVASDMAYNGILISICTSVLVTGSPGKRKLNEEHIVTLDIRAQYRDYHGIYA